MRAFVVRPFGTKEGVDFDRVQNELITPAFEKLGLKGDTTAEIVQAGNIREDMFALLLTADLVVADVTLHNANVFYELGIRHARRRRGTFLLRGALPKSHQQQDVPFDIKTDRYLAYDPNVPAGKLDALVDGLRATIAGEGDDSPLYGLLTKHGEELPQELPPPSGFTEDVDWAKGAKDAGILALLAEEAQYFPWSRAALRQAGRALSSMAAYESARDVWGKIIESERNDYEANKHLGDAYHRLENLADSTLALQRVLKSDSAKPAQRAEILGQQGRNTKEEWRREWINLPELKQRREAAQRSPGLGQALEQYRRAFNEDLNAYYPGINALALQVIAAGFPGEPPASARESPAELAAMVRAAVHRSLELAERAGKTDPWAQATLSDLAFLTSDDPKAVAKAYGQALWKSETFDRDTVIRQLDLFRLLGLREKVLEAAYHAVAPAPGGEIERPARVLLFTGHRLDAPGRNPPRFPAPKEDAARARIHATVKAELEGARGTVFGIAGAASGGDILFHEVCGELGIQSAIYLALPPDKYRAESVQDAGPGWVERFNALLETRPHRVLNPDGVFPGWLQTRKNYDIWERSNRWMLHSALVSGAKRLTLIALWDGKPKGDGPGGTADLVHTVSDYGAKQEVIKTTEL